MHNEDKHAHYTISVQNMPVTATVVRHSALMTMGSDKDVVLPPDRCNGDLPQAAREVSNTFASNASNVKDRRIE